MKLGGNDISTVKLGASQVQAIYSGTDLVWQNAPVATAATGIGQTSFTANWEAYTGAVYYLLDVSESSDFSTFIYENQVVTSTSYVVIGLNPNTTYYYRVRASTEPLYLLDDWQYPNAAAAYSLRKLRSGYTGSAIRVRRSVGTPAETDIGFVDGELDTSTLATFCSGTDGFVVTWYDQSGSIPANDATQAAVENQPQIVSSGSVILENGKPALDFDGSSSFLPLNVTMSNNFANSTNKTLICVNKDDGITGVRNRPLFIGSGNSTRVSLINESATQFDATFNGYSNRVVVTFNIQQQFLVFGQDISGTHAFYLNSTTSGTNNFGGTNNDIDGAEISNASNGQYMNGNIQEIILWSSDQSSNRTGIEDNINDFYSIYYVPSDADAQAFVSRVETAGGSLSATEKKAVDTLVSDLKADGIWNKMKAIYPMVGASAAACAQNLKSSSFTGTFTSGWTFASTGVKGNGTSAYMNTGLLSNDFTDNKGGYTCYTRDNNSPTGVKVQYGSFGNNWVISWMNVKGYGINGNGGYGTFSSIPNNYKGSVVNQRVDDSNIKINFSGGNQTVANTIPTTLDNTKTIYVGAWGDNSTGLYHTDNEIAFFAKHDFLDETESVNFIDSIQAFQTTLSRNV